MSPKHLLIAEDDDGIARLVASAAKKAGFESRCVHDGLELTRIYDEFQPEVIVLDILMPNMDGIETLSFLNTCGRKAQIIILSGQGNYRHWTERMGVAYNLSIVATVSKPFRMAELRQLFETIMTAPSSPQIQMATHGN